MALNKTLSQLAIAVGLSDADLALIRQGTDDKSMTMQLLYDYIINKNPLAQSLLDIVTNAQSIIDTPTGLYRNPYINSDKVITQRGDFTTPAAILDGVYGVDRFKSLVTGAIATFQHVSANQPAALSGSLSTKYVATSTASGTLGEIQPVEDVNYLKLVGQNLIQGVWVKSNSTDARVLVWDGSTFTSSTAHTGGGAWELLSVGSPPLTDLQLYVVIASATGASVSITSGDFIEMTGNTGNEGTTLLPFQPRHYSEEINLCERYYEVLGDHQQYSAEVISGNTYRMPVNFKKVKRTATPTITLTDLGVTNFPVGAPTIVSPQQYGFKASKTANGTGLGAYGFGGTVEDEL